VHGFVAGWAPRARHGDGDRERKKGRGTDTSNRVKGRTVDVVMHISATANTLFVQRACQKRRRMGVDRVGRRAASYYPHDDLGSVRALKANRFNRCWHALFILRQ